MKYKLFGIVSFAGSILCIFAGCYLLSILAFIAGVVLCFVYTKKYGVDKKNKKHNNDHNYAATTWWYLNNN